MDTPVRIASRDYWFKVVDMLQQNWALIDTTQDTAHVTVFFVHDGSGVFDRMQFRSAKEAEKALLRNGFNKFGEDTHAHDFITPPAPPFMESRHSNGPIYSSGRFWC